VILGYAGCRVAPIPARQGCLPRRGVLALSIPDRVNGPFLLKLLSAVLRQWRLRCGMAINPHDHHVITSRSGERPERWGWEIRRKSTPLGIKMVGDHYQSDAAAQFAGKQALADFLLDLAKEEKRSGK
jgi:hypothetical protein